MSVAIVTGAARGLGNAISRRLADDGLSVACLDIDAAGVETTAAAIRAGGRTAQSWIVDLSETANIDRVIGEVADSLGDIVGLVNNAAVFPSGPFLEVDAADYDHTIQVNQRAYFFTAQSAARHMAASGGGSIVNMGSITQHGGWSEMAPYVVTKGAAAALTRALATELGALDIRVNCVAPGAFPTRAEEVHTDPDAYTRRILDSQALKRRGTLEELAAVVSFLVGPESSFVTGQTLNVDGGWQMA